MVTIKPIAGLGNQMFQLSFIYAYAKRYGLKYAVPLQVENPHIPGKGTYVFQGINYSGSIPEFPLYKELHFHYTPVHKMDNISFYGYWQSWKYFYEYKDDLKKIFGFADLPTNYDFCSIHVRMGDYVNYPDHHPVVSIDYLKKAIDTIIGDYSFQIFSDDIEAAKKYIPVEIFGGRNYEFEETGDELADMKYMAMAEHQITANSSFSWWAAFLSSDENPFENKQIIMPAKWFGPQLAHNNTRDLYLPHSIII